jgi:hypothetical protein
MAGFSAGKNLQNNINVDEAQTLSNKTLDNTTTIQSGADIQTPAIIDPSRADVKKDTLANLQTYASSASNGQLVYATDSKKMFQVLDGALAEVGGGSAGINYITNPDAEVNADGWSNYANSVAGELPDDFGGTVSGSWDNIAASAASPLRGSKSFVFGGINSGSGDLQGHGVYSSFTVDSADLAKKLTISFDYKLDDSALTNAVDGMLKVFIYDEDKSQLIRVNGEDIQLNANTNTHIAQFQTDATSTNYRLVIHNALALNVAEDFSMKIDNIQVGPREVAKGTIVTDWVDSSATLTATTTNPTFSASTSKQRRIGDSLSINLTVSSFSNAGSGTYYLSLPDGLSVDLSKTNDGEDSQVGGFIQDATNRYSILAITAPSDNTKLTIVRSDSLTTVTNSTLTWTSSGIFSINVEGIPIQGWSSNTVTSEDLGGREVVMEAVLSSNTSYTSNSLHTIIYDQVNQDTTASYDNSTGEYTIPESGKYLIEGALPYADSAAINADQTAVLEIDLNGTRYGLDSVKSADSSSRNYNLYGTRSLSLNKGDVIKLRTVHTLATSPLSTQIGTNSEYFRVTKLASPQTILETETVAARYTSNSGQPLQTIDNTTAYVYENINADTHNAYDGTGVYTIPVSGWYDIDASLSSATGTYAAGNLLKCSILVNDSIIAANFHRFDSTYSSTYKVSTSTKIYLNKGDELKVVGIKTGSSVNSLPDDTLNYFSIARIK